MPSRAWHCKPEQINEFTSVFLPGSFVRPLVPVLFLYEMPVGRLFKSSPLSPARRLQWKSFRGPGVVRWGMGDGG